MLSSYQILVCVILYHSVISSNPANVRYVKLECVKNCIITDGKINGGEGDNITLKYVINTTNIKVFVLNYHAEMLIMVYGKELSLYPYPSIPLHSTTLKNSTYGYWFSFKVINLNRTIHSGKPFAYTLTRKDAPKQKEDQTSTINVQYGPNLLGIWNPTYNVNETNDIDVTLILSGNPKPTVKEQWKTDIFDVKGSRGPSQYTYNVKLKHVNRSECGKNLILEVNGYHKNISYITNINVTFTPSVPNNISANFTQENCLIVHWKKIESGVCNVKYTLIYTYNNIYNNETNTFNDTSYKPRYTHCFNTTASFNGTVRLQAEVGGRIGNLSDPVSVFLLPPTSTTTPTTTTLTTTPTTITTTTTTITTTNPTTSQSTRNSTHTTTAAPQSDGSKTTIIALVIVGVILVLVIIIVFLVCTGRIKCCNNREANRKAEGTPSPEPNGAYSVQNVRYNADNETTEANYADVNSIQVPNRQPVQEMDYAELGPGGGRIGERPLAEPSLYAQVNTDGAYYPPLNSRGPSSKQKPEYATSTKTRAPPIPQVPEYADSTKATGLPSNQEPEYAVLAKGPPTTQEPEYAVSTKARILPSIEEPEYAVSTKARVSPSTKEPEYAVSTKAKGQSSTQETNDVG